MAGRGPAPKDPNKRRRNNSDPVPTTHLTQDDVRRGPDLIPGPWHEMTIKWWEMWRDSPQAAEFTDSDWSFLLDTAILHNLLWANTDDDKVVAKVSAELRIRVAKFGATPEDRARLRMQFADSDTDDTTTAAASQYAHLRSVK